MMMSITRPAEAPTLFHDPEAPDYQPSSAFLSDEAYTAALNGLVMVCADTILYNRERRTVYLAQRSVYPMVGYWILGGRVQRGKDGWEAMLRLLKTDTSRDFDPAKLEYLSMNRYNWRLRKQEPVDGGSDNLCYTYGYEPSREELDAIRAGLNPAEYDTDFGLQEFTYEELVEVGVHQVILKLYRELFPPRRTLLQRLCDAYAAFRV